MRVIASGDKSREAVTREEVIREEKRTAVNITALTFDR